MFDFKITGITEAIARVARTEQTLESKMQTLIGRLVKEGYDVADYAYSTAAYAGVRDYNLEIQADGNTMYLIASGKSIAFIEFGSGVGFAEYPSDIPGNGGNPYSTLGLSQRGEFGDKHGANPPWTYVGDPGNIGTVIHEKDDGRSVVRTSGNPPARGMYEAAVKVADLNLAVQIAREVFKA